MEVLGCHIRMGLQPGVDDCQSGQTVIFNQYSTLFSRRGSFMSPEERKSDVASLEKPWNEYHYHNPLDPSQGSVNNVITLYKEVSIQQTMEYLVSPSKPIRASRLVARPKCFHGP